jgi:hypothetical protein
MGDDQASRKHILQLHIIIIIIIIIIITIVMRKAEALPRYPYIIIHMFVLPAIYFPYCDVLISLRSGQGIFPVNSSARRSLQDVPASVQHPTNSAEVELHPVGQQAVLELGSSSIQQPAIRISRRSSTSCARSTPPNQR